MIPQLAAHVRPVRIKASPTGMTRAKTKARTKTKTKARARARASCDGEGEDDVDGDAWGVGDSVGEYDDDGDSDGWTEDGPWVACRLTAGDGLALADARLAAEAGAAAGRLEEVPAVG